MPIDGYYNLEDLEDVEAYIEDILQPALDAESAPLKYVYIERPRYDIFTIHTSEYAGYAGLTQEQKQVLADRYNSWVQVQQTGGNPFVDNINGYLVITNVSAKNNSIYVVLSGVPVGTELKSVQWSFEKAPNTGDFNVYKLNTLPRVIADADPNTAGNADLVFDNGDFVKFKWLDIGLEAREGNMGNLFFGWGGTQDAEVKNIMVKVKALLTNQQTIEAVGFVSIPAV